MTSPRPVQRQLQQQPQRAHDAQWMQQQCTRPQAWTMGTSGQQTAGDAHQRPAQQQGGSAPDHPR